GGFIERVEPDGTLVADVRRARLVARQIYVFRMAAELGWKGNARALVDHGLAALRRCHIGADDDVAIPRYHPASDTSE
ncbi:AGE family epimerase/isomerase, partial [Rhizobium johnstonii]